MQKSVLKDTNKVATKTKEWSQTLRRKNELKCLQIKWNKQQPILPSERWPIIENQIHEQIKHIINKKNTILLMQK